jgi:hypothetical protein
MSFGNILEHQVRATISDAFKDLFVHMAPESWAQQSGISRSPLLLVVGRLDAMLRVIGTGRSS